MRVGIALLALFAAVVSIAAAPLDRHKWRDLHFDRFGTEVEIPVDIFTSHSTPENGDGGTWRSDDGARLLVFGQWNIEERTPAAQAAWLKEIDPQRYAALSYKLVTRRVLVLTGTLGSTIYYERYRFDDPSGAVHAVVLEYPKSLRGKYDPLVGRISTSLRWTKPL